MPQPKERSDIQVQAERAVLAAVRLPSSSYDRRDPFGELRALAEQAGAIVVGELEQHRDRPEAGTFMGSGKLVELRDLCNALDAGTIIFDHDLSPKQLGAIEEVTGRKIIDRSELILDIFAGRATTAEAQLQVELAQLEYTYPRLRAMWSHLERITGGSGGARGIGTRGPGEMQLEIDRRLVQAKKNDLQRRLREIQARKRAEVRKRKIDNFTVGIVGYTNAGKSTLFNTLTSGGAYADNRLFATLITRTREWDMGGGLSVMLSDTVGFVRDLPHNLVASFKATLEEATHADLLLIVLDVSDPSAELQYTAVMQTLDELEAAIREGGDGEEDWVPPQRLLLLNKADRLRDNRELLLWQQKVPGSIAICALPPGQSDRQADERSTEQHRIDGIEARRIADQIGHAELRDRVKAAMRGSVQEVKITVPTADSRTIHVIENRSDVTDRTYDGSTVTLRTRIGSRQLDQLRSAGARMVIEYPDGSKAHWPPRAAEREGWGR